MKITRLKMPGRIGRSVLFLLLLLIGSQFVKAQSRVSGTVKDETGQPLPGVTVQVKGKTTAVGTDVNGAFTISADKADVLHISFVGYVAQDVAVGSQAIISVSLQPEAKNLDEVIVTGYSRQSKHDVTGAASTVKGSVIQQTPVTSLEGALEGRVAGLVVDGQGGPGNSASIRIRGIGTLANPDPLYVIDGVQIRIGTNGSEDISNLLNPNDIESVTVLKDPSLIALYGARGANGVIVITTKSGKNGAPQLQYDGYVGYENPKNLLKTITPQQQADALYASYKNSNVPIPTSVSSFYGTGSTPVLPDYIIENVNGSANIGVSADDPKAAASLYNQQSYRILKANKSGTNWWDLLFNPALTQNHNLALSGATDKSNYAVTMGYLDDQGTLLNSYFQRYSFRVNTSFKIKPWLRFGENIEASFSSQNTTNRGATNDIQSLYMLSPLLPEFDIQGNVSGTNHAAILGGSNPYNDRVNSKTDKNYSQSIIGSAYAEADLVKGLTYTNQIGFQLLPNEYHGYSPVSPQEPIPGTANVFSEGGDYTTDWRWLNKLSYTTTINKIHNITAFVGYEVNKNVERNYGGEAFGILYPSANTEYLGNGTSYPGVPVFGGGDKSTSLSEFGNVTYSLLDKYLFTATGRRDGSSKFGPNDVYGNFGALSVGWRISQEDFLKNVSWLNDLKLKASYGTIGSDAASSPTGYLTLLSGGSFGNYDLGGTNTTSLNGFYLSQFGNSDEHWETNRTTNIGFDASLFHNSLTVSFDWFNRETIGLLYQPPAPGTAGSAQSPILNIMNFTNKGVELELNYNSHIGNVKYNMGFNIATLKNNINYIDGLAGAHFQQGVVGSNGANYLNRNEVGHPVGEFYGYVYQGLYRTQADITGHATEASIGITPENALGHVMYKDLNNDKVIDADNDETYLGSPIPKFTYGYNLDVSYKNLDIGLFFQGSYGNKIYNYARQLQQYPNANGSGIGGLVVGSLDTWSPSNPNAALPIFAQSSTAQDIQPSSFFIESGSYLRLKTATLGYTFTKLKGIKRLRIYAQAFNLLTITKYRGMDPEVNDGTPNNLGIDYGTAYPITQKFLFGVNLGL